MSTLLRAIQNLGFYRLAALGLGVLTVTVLMLVYFYKVSSGNMDILYADLDDKDSQQIVQNLDSQGIKYELFNNGKIIKVPSSQISKIRMEMAKSGIPSRGTIIGYEIFDKEESLGTTNFLQNVKLIRALEGELSRTIEYFEQIYKARVHLVIPQKELFSKDKQQPSASVMLQMKKGKVLNKSEVDSISYLISTAVPNLDIKNITIVDTKGKSLKLGGLDEVDLGYTSSNNEQYRILYEDRLKYAIEDLLEKSIGIGKVKAQVSVEMNFDRIVTNAELYDPNNVAVRSSQVITNNERTPVDNGENVDVSVANNLPENFGNYGNSNSLAIVDRNEETTNYEISKTIKNQISEVGSIKKLSVAVLVDGTYKIVNEKLEYTPRTPEELKQIESLVKTTVGFYEDRQDQIQVANMQFSQDDTEVEQSQDIIDWVRQELPSLLQTIILAILVALIFITVIKPIALGFFENNKVPIITSSEASKDIDEEKFISSSTVEKEDPKKSEWDQDNILKKIEGSIVYTEKMNETVRNYPEECLAVLRHWINEG